MLALLEWLFCDIYNIYCLVYLDLGMYLMLIHFIRFFPLITFNILHIQLFLYII